MCFCLASKNTGICSVVRISSHKNYWYLQQILHFYIVLAKDVKPQKCCHLQHFVSFEKLKIVRKMCQKVASGDACFRGPGSEGRRLGARLCQWRTEKPQRSAEKAPNVSLETFPKELETTLPARLPKTRRQVDTAAQNTAPGQGKNTMPVKDGETTKKRWKRP